MNKERTGLWLPQKEHIGGHGDDRKTFDVIAAT